MNITNYQLAKEAKTRLGYSYDYRPFWKMTLGAFLTCVLLMGLNYWRLGWNQSRYYKAVLMLAVLHFVVSNVVWRKEREKFLDEFRIAVGGRYPEAFAQVQAYLMAQKVKILLIKPSDLCLENEEEATREECVVAAYATRFSEVQGFAAEFGFLFSFLAGILIALFF